MGKARGWYYEFKSTARFFGRGGFAGRGAVSFHQYGDGINVLLQLGLPYVRGSQLYQRACDNTPHYRHSGNVLQPECHVAQNRLGAWRHFFAFDDHNGYPIQV
jgi:hypothetical protein